MADISLKEIMTAPFPTKRPLPLEQAERLCCELAQWYKDGGKFTRSLSLILLAFFRRLPSELKLRLHAGLAGLSNENIRGPEDFIPFHQVVFPEVLKICSRGFPKQFRSLPPLSVEGADAPVDVYKTPEELADAPVVYKFVKDVN